jgi:hypothetical protein
MKRLLLFLLFMVNLQIVIQKDGVAMTLFSETYAQHMDLEGGNYDCLDEEIGWYRSLIPCDGLIITPDETYAECSWCHERFSTSEIWDHEYVCPERERQSQDSWGNDDGSNSSGGGGGAQSGGGTGGGSTGGSSSSDIHSGSNGKPLSVIFPVSNTTPINKLAAAMAGLVYNDEDSAVFLKYCEKHHWEIKDSLQYISGFKVMLLERRDSSNNFVGYVCSFAGTDPDYPDVLPDAYADFQNAIGVLTEQYIEAIIWAINLNNSIGEGVELTFVGHSLGGGLAAIASMLTGRNAITFNPAAVGGLGYQIAENLGILNLDTSHIFGYIMEGDPVNMIQNSFGIYSEGNFVRVHNGTGDDSHGINNMFNNLQP